MQLIFPYHFKKYDKPDTWEVEFYEYRVVVVKRSDNEYKISIDSVGSCKAFIATSHMAINKILIDIKPDHNY